MGCGSRAVAGTASSEVVAMVGLQQALGEPATCWLHQHVHICVLLYGYVCMCVFVCACVCM